jgi:phage terminase large subunit-like protein
VGRRQQSGIASDYVAKAFDYQAAVLSGELPQCDWVRMAMARNDRNLKTQKTKAFPYRFDEVAAHAICLAGEQFPHIKGPHAYKVCPVHKQKQCRKCDPTEFVWNTIKLEPWQCWIFSTLFGWKRLADDLRRFKTGLILVPRKNSKSTMAAIIGNYMLAADGESGAEVYSVATKHDQAKIIFEVAQEMARRSPQFREYFGVTVGAHALSVLPTLSKFLAVGADADTLDGLNVSCALVDEVHAHKTRHVWDVMETATGTRDQPLVLGVSTAGINIAGILYELLTYLRKILEGVFTDETFFGVNWTIDEGDDWRSPEAHKKANPNYAISVRPDDLERKVAKASQSPAAINNFLTKHLNVWTKAESTWLSTEAWAKCANPTLRIEDCLGSRCWLTIDLAEVRDIAAKGLLFEREDGRFAFFCRFYLPKQTVEGSPVAQYSGWERQGLIIATEGNVTDYLRLEDDAVEWVNAYLPEAVGFDRALASRMMQNLQARLGEKPPVEVLPQNTITMDPAMKRLEELVMGQRIEHDGNPVLAWMISNVVVQRNHKGEIYPRKAGGKDSNNKIDGVLALLMGLAKAMIQPPEETSVYETRGIAVI